MQKRGEVFCLSSKHKVCSHFPDRLYTKINLFYQDFMFRRDLLAKPGKEYIASQRYSEHCAKHCVSHDPSATKT